MFTRKFKFDHSQEEFADALGVKRERVIFLMFHLFMWGKDNDKKSQTVEMIVNSEEFNDLEKIFLLSNMSKSDMAIAVIKEITEEE